MKTILTILSFLVMFFSGISAQSIEGTTWSYTERIFGDPEVKTITSYFMFTTSSEVLWMFETPSNNILPIGIGKYNKDCGTITFTHENITLYFQNTEFENTIVFDFKPIGELGTMTCHNTDFWPSYNNGKPFTITKEKFHFAPDATLIDTWWKCVEIEGEPTSPHSENYILYFKSQNEVLVNGDKLIYICLGDRVFFVAKDQVRGLVGIISEDTMSIDASMDGILFSTETYMMYQHIMRFSKIK